MWHWRISKCSSVYCICLLNFCIVIMFSFSFLACSILIELWKRAIKHCHTDILLGSGEQLEVVPVSYRPVSSASPGLPLGRRPLLSFNVVSLLLGTKQKLQQTPDLLLTHGFVFFRDAFLVRLGGFVAKWKQPCIVLKWEIPFFLRSLKHSTLSQHNSHMVCI